MSEQEPLGIAEEFARYRRTVLAEVEAPGPAAVRRAARQRGRRRLAATTTAALALLSGSAIGYAATNGPDPQPGPVEPTPSVSASPTPSDIPSPSVTSASPTSTVPDGRISRAKLLETPVTLPAWRAGPGCPTSQIRLTADAREGTNWLMVLDHGDVDGDGAVETVALVQCVLGTGGPMQVVAFDRNEDNEVITLGRVVASTRDKPQWLFALDVVDGGTVRVQVGDLAPGGGWDARWSQRQWRSYRWTGDAFAQTSGPTTFGPNPHLVNLSVTAADFSWGPKEPDGTRTGTMEVVVRNVGTTPAALVELNLGLQPGAVAEGGGWSVCAGGPPSKSPLTCRFGPLAPGATRTLQLGLRDKSTMSGSGIARVRPIGAADNPLFESAQEDNEDRYRYR
ncbi:hypothetical protein ABZ403_16295 [Micromonospora zamorensis]|uniref:hypothetical protein n=1 Tax=Micromonospora zamorensis TaxID=709883 RepID=UPI0033E64D76